MSEKIFTIDQGLFYITNVCNLTCSGCETYNNRKFKGHCQWATHESEYTEWSKKLDIDFITIIGGEPFTNPDLINWIHGLKKLWPQCDNFNICTNGTYLKNNKDIIELCVEQGIWLDISCHDPVMFDSIRIDLEESLKKYTIATVTENNKLDFYKDSTKVACLYQAYTFQQSSQKKVVDGVIYMHNSNVYKSHELCVSNLGHCHSFVKGNLYKCYLTGISQDLVSQFEIEDRAKNLLKSYQPCSPWNSNSAITDFLKVIQHPIPQCTLCPERKTIFPIWPLFKKKLNV